MIASKELDKTELKLIDLSENLTQSKLTTQVLKMNRLSFLKWLQLQKVNTLLSPQN